MSSDAMLDNTVRREHGLTECSCGRNCLSGSDTVLQGDGQGFLTARADLEDKRCIRVIMRVERLSQNPDSCLFPLEMEWESLFLVSLGGGKGPAASNLWFRVYSEPVLEFPPQPSCTVGGCLDAVSPSSEDDSILAIKRLKQNKDCSCGPVECVCSLHKVLGCPCQGPRISSITEEVEAGAPFICTLICWSLVFKPFLFSFA